MSDVYALELKNITKTFPGSKVLDNVSFGVKKGHVHALLGANGAGKSTLIRIIAGIYDCDEGSLMIDGQEMHFKAPIDAQLKGIGVVHQEIMLSETLSVTENIFLGHLLYKHGWVVDWETMGKKARAMLDDLHMEEIDENALVETLPIAKKQVVEICKTINLNCRILIMDEPSATLTEKELKVLFEIIEKLKADGVTIIYISHRMDEIFKIADDFTVLRDGCHVRTGELVDVSREELIAMMVGRELSNEYPREEHVRGELVVEARNLVNNRLNDVSLKIYRGELLGISGLVGAGRTELARAIMGIDSIESGEVYVYGKLVDHKNFRNAINNGFGLIPEDRLGQGIVGIAPVKENVTLVNMGGIIKNGIVQPQIETEVAEEYRKKLNIATSSVNSEIRHLSGGNQQKVVIAKWLYQDSDIIFLDEPTRGIDVGAKAEIYKLINHLLNIGKCVVMISSDMPELLGMCDRIAVMRDGELVGEFSHEEATREKILALCV